MFVNVELIETYHRDGTISARGIGVKIKPKYGGYDVITRAPGGSKHGTRHYLTATYEAALERALHWHRVTLPRRMKGG